MLSRASSIIKGIVFDLDGTLYVNDTFAALIQKAAQAYIAGLREIPHDEAELLMTATRRRLSAESGSVQTLSAVCAELGGTIRELHRFFSDNLCPEALLVPDERVIQLLHRLAGRFTLFLYTNNNRALTTRIVRQLGLEGLFRSIYTIDDTWQGKPDEGMLARVMADTGLAASETLFVGDRYDIDLRVPEQQGSPVYLSQSMEQLLRLEELLVDR
jgi:putative hydrolase of the HAD superfamily